MQVMYLYNSDLKVLREIADFLNLAGCVESEQMGIPQQTIEAWEKKLREIAG
jgi:hypothetical protein